ncbi:hypothetical protein ES705_42124 [subsurface metagenome]
MPILVHGANHLLKTQVHLLPQYEGYQKFLLRIAICPDKWEWVRNRVYRSQDSFGPSELNYHLFQYTKDIELSLFPFHRQYWVLLLHK